ncbi:hypothetical protein ACP70R_032527 [Stipagrostis hirtigluma subsp. patula]
MGGLRRPSLRRLSLGFAALVVVSGELVTAVAAAAHRSTEVTNKISPFPLLSSRRSVEPVPPTAANLALTPASPPPPTPPTPTPYLHRSTLPPPSSATVSAAFFPGVDAVSLPRRRTRGSADSFAGASSPAAAAAGLHPSGVDLHRAVIDDDLVPDATAGLRGDGDKPGENPLPPSLRSVTAHSDVVATKTWGSQMLPKGLHTQVLHGKALVRASLLLKAQLQVDQLFDLTTISLMLHPYFSVYCLSPVIHHQHPQLNTLPPLPLCTREALGCPRCCHPETLFAGITTDLPRDIPPLLYDARST